MRSRGLTPYLVCASLVLGFSGCPGGSGSDRCTLECMGCCSNGVCQAGSTSTACGGAGAACQICPSGKSCVNNSCQVGGGGCSSTSCLQGCCKGDTCVPLASQSVASCGTGGAACQTCSSGTCTNGSCSGGAGCSAANCLGCCASDQCFLFAQQSTALCGKSGAACSACSPQGQCANGSCSGSTCSASTCSAGCCSSAGGCLPVAQQSTGACGTSGAVCAACPNAGQCLNGVCQGTACGPANCQGCCQGATCLIYGQQTSTQCGKGGAACQSCGGLACQNGLCSGDPGRSAW